MGLGCLVLRVVTLLFSFWLVSCLPCLQQVVQQLLDGSFPLAPNVELDLVDVRDVAKAHVEALERPTAAGRYLTIGANITVLEVGVPPWDSCPAMLPRH